MENWVEFLYQLFAKAVVVGRCNIQLLSLQMPHLNNGNEDSRFFNLRISLFCRWFWTENGHGDGLDKVQWPFINWGILLAPAQAWSTKLKQLPAIVVLWINKSKKLIIWLSLCLALWEKTQDARIKQLKVHTLEYKPLSGMTFPEWSVIPYMHLTAGNRHIHSSPSRHCRVMNCKIKGRSFSLKEK